MFVFQKEKDLMVVCSQSAGGVSPAPMIMVIRDHLPTDHAALIGRVGIAGRGSSSDSDSVIFTSTTRFHQLIGSTGGAEKCLSTNAPKTLSVVPFHAVNGSKVKTALP